MKTVVHGYNFDTRKPEDAAAYKELCDIEQAQQNEAQANGLEDECKSMLHGPLKTLLPNGGWKLEHVPMPACPDGLKRTIDAPERDEVDALTITCGP